MNPGKNFTHKKVKPILVGAVGQVADEKQITSDFERLAAAMQLMDGWDNVDFLAAYLWFNRALVGGRVAPD